MSSPWRIKYEGALYHYLLRRNEIFKNSQDRGSIGTSVPFISFAETFLTILQGGQGHACML